MKRILFGTLVVGLLVLQGCGEAGMEAVNDGLPWQTDLAKALQQAKTENKMVLMDFTGSDWCPPCKALHSTVLTSKEFANFASTNLVLVEVDFPHSKAQSKELKEANAALSEKFKIEGFPTIIVLSADGKELKRRDGYGGETAGEFVAMLAHISK